MRGGKSRAGNRQPEQGWIELSMWGAGDGGRAENRGVKQNPGVSPERGWKRGNATNQQREDELQAERCVGHSSLRKNQFLSRDRATASLCAGLSCRSKGSACGSTAPVAMQLYAVGTVQAFQRKYDALSLAEPPL